MFPLKPTELLKEEQCFRSLCVVQVMNWVTTEIAVFIFITYIRCHTGTLEPFSEGTAEYKDGSESLQIVFHNKYYTSPSTRSNVRD
jgi:hypothetical protein